MEKEWIAINSIRMHILSYSYETRSGMSSIDLYFFVQTRILWSKLLKLLFSLPWPKDVVPANLSKFLADFEKNWQRTPIIDFDAIERNIFHCWKFRTENKNAIESVSKQASCCNHRKNAMLKMIT